MLYLFISILGILITIFFVIGTHEAAHFFAARLLGIKVLRFSIGFGKTLFKWNDRSGTEYVVAVIPLGGYVKMLDEGEGPVLPEELPRAFNRQPYYKKFLIVLAGPLANIFCAFVLYWIIFMMGFTTIKPIIGNINPDSIAAKSGMQPNAQIIGIDGKDISTWPGIMFRIIVHAGNKDSLQLTTRSVSNPGSINHYTLDLKDWNIGGLTPDPLSSLGIIPYQPTIPLIIGVLAANSPAQTSKLAVGDKIIAINQEKITSWEQVITSINQHPDQKVIFTVERQGQIVQLPVEVGFQRNGWFQKTGYLGIAPAFKIPPELLQKIQFTPFTAIPRAAQEIYDFTYFNFLLFGKIILGKLSLQSLGGPITIFQTAGDALNYGLLSFLGFLAFLSISIGVINLIPIPGLDGGHLLFQTIEFIFQKPIPNNVLLLFYRLGFLLLFVVLIQALMNDILRLA